jgi:hypothetical protein
VTRFTSVKGLYGFRGFRGKTWRYRRQWRPPVEQGFTRAVSLPVKAHSPSTSSTSEKALWCVIGLLAVVVFVNLVRPSQLCYIVVLLGLPLAFLSPATALATYILTVLVPNAFGENNIAARLPVLLFVPLAYHAFLHLRSQRPPSQRIILVLQGILCLLVGLLALAYQSLSEILELIHLYLGPIALLLAAVPLWTLSDRRFLFKVFVLAGTIVSVKTLFRFASHDSGFMLEASALDLDALRGTADKLDPNYMACYIGLGVICALYLLMENPSSRNKRYLALGWLVPILVSLVAMGKLASRGMTLALAASLSVLVAIAPLKRSARAAVLGLVLVVGFGVGMAGGFDLLWTRFQNEDVKTGAGRMDINLIALRLFTERSLDGQLLGGGNNSSFRAMGWHTHNAYTEQLMDQGIVGASCFLGIFGCLGAACARTKGPVRASGLALLVFLAVASLSISPFRYAWGWIALACILPCRQEAVPLARCPRRSNSACHA